jgi:hypothetical protein
VTFYLIFNFEIIKNKNKLETFVLFLTYRESTGEKQGETIQVYTLPLLSGVALIHGRK